MILSPYILPLLRWWRLIALVTLLAAGVSTVSTMFQPNVYVSRTTLVIGTTFLNPNPDSGQLYISQQLAQIYADMARREPIQEATKAALGIGWLPQYESRVVPNTQMVEISVTDVNPQRAQIVANEIANQLILQSPAIGKTETGERQDFITQQLTSLQSQIVDTERQIEELQKSLVDLTSASQIANVQREINEQTQRLTSLRASYAGFLANSQEGAVNVLNVVDPANLPSRPVGTNRITIIFLAGLVGFSLGTGAAYLLEYLDRTVKTTSDVERIFKLPVIGYISEIPDEEDRATYVSHNPDSILAENFRLLSSNIDFFRISNPLKTLLITSPSPGTGKTTVASNLAWSIAQEADGVILVDADLRRPAVHTSLGVSKNPGLADLITNKADLQSVVKEWNSGGYLKVITAGNIPSKVTEVAGSKRIAATLAKLKENYELVIIDAPPLIIADSYNLASSADGVIIVLQPGETSDEQARTIKEQLDRAEARIVGVVFNRISEESGMSYYDYHYRSTYSPKYYGDYHSKSEEQPATGSRSKAILAFLEHGNLPSKITKDDESSISEVKRHLKNIFQRNGKSKDNSHT